MKSRKFIAIASFLFVVVAAIAIIFAIKLSTKKTVFPDGQWNGVGEGRNGPIELTVSVQDGKIVDVVVTKEDETDFSKPATKYMIDQVIAKQKLDGLDAMSGSSITSKATIEGIKNALASATGESGVAAKAEDASCDIVVIGTGGAGLTAAYQASSRGAKVIVLEKLGVVGGNTNSATAGLNASETSVQKTLGIADTNAQFFDDTMKGGHELNNKELVNTMVNNSASIVDYLIGIGADLSDVGMTGGSTNARSHRPQGGAAVGSMLVNTLKSADEKAGVDIRMNSNVTGIINDNGKASGVTVSSPAGDYKISANAVIIATGGFGANPEMIVKYKPELEGFGTTNHKGATGDAFAWVEPFDGALVDMEQIQTHPTVVPKNGVMITESVRGNGAILINREGKRFINELLTRDVVSDAILKQTGKTVYLVFDQGVRDSLKAIESYAKQGLLTEADTLENLASKLNIPSDALSASLEKYNASQASGNDSEFGRNAKQMPRPIATSPYYAVEIGPAVHHTMGGLKINTKAEVLNKSDNAIPGLYAAGEVTGGIHGGNRLGGNAVVDIEVFGKIAADSACDFIGK